MAGSTVPGDQNGEEEDFPPPPPPPSASGTAAPRPFPPQPLLVGVAQFDESYSSRKRKEPGGGGQGEGNSSQDDEDDDDDGDNDPPGKRLASIFNKRTTAFNAADDPATLSSHIKGFEGKAFVLLTFIHFTHPSRFSHLYVLQFLRATHACKRLPLVHTGHLFGPTESGCRRMPGPSREMSGSMVPKRL